MAVSGSRRGGSCCSALPPVKLFGTNETFFASPDVSPPSSARPLSRSTLQSRESQPMSARASSKPTRGESGNRGHAWWRGLRVWQGGQASVDYECHTNMNDGGDQGDTEETSTGRHGSHLNSQQVQCTGDSFPSGLGGTSRSSRVTKDSQPSAHVLRAQRIGAEQKEWFRMRQAGQKRASEGMKRHDVLTHSERAWFQLGTLPQKADWTRSLRSPCEDPVDWWQKKKWQRRRQEFALQQLSVSQKSWLERQRKMRRQHEARQQEVAALESASEIEENDDVVQDILVEAEESEQSDATPQSESTDGSTRPRPRRVSISSDERGSRGSLPVADFDKERSDSSPLSVSDHSVSDGGANGNQAAQRRPREKDAASAKGTDSSEAASISVSKRSSVDSSPGVANEAYDVHPVIARPRTASVEKAIIVEEDESEVSGRRRTTKYEDTWMEWRTLFTMETLNRCASLYEHAEKNDDGDGGRTILLGDFNKLLTAIVGFAPEATNAEGLERGIFGVRRDKSRIRRAFDQDQPMVFTSFTHYLGFLRDVTERIQEDYPERLWGEEVMENVRALFRRYAKQDRLPMEKVFLVLSLLQIDSIEVETTEQQRVLADMTREIVEHRDKVCKNNISSLAMGDFVRLMSMARIARDTEQNLRAFLLEDKFREAAGLNRQDIEDLRELFDGFKDVRKEGDLLARFQALLSYCDLPHPSTNEVHKLSDIAQSHVKGKDPSFIEFLQVMKSISDAGIAGLCLSPSEGLPPPENVGFVAALLRDEARLFQFSQAEAVQEAASVSVIAPSPRRTSNVASDDRRPASRTISAASSSRSKGHAGKKGKRSMDGSRANSRTISRAASSNVSRGHSPMPDETAEPVALKGLPPAKAVLAGRNFRACSVDHSAAIEDENNSRRQEKEPQLVPNSEMLLTDMLMKLASQEVVSPDPSDDGDEDDDSKERQEALCLAERSETQRSLDVLEALRDNRETAPDAAAKPRAPLECAPPVPTGWAYDPAGDGET